MRLFNAGPRAGMRAVAGAVMCAAVCASVPAEAGTLTGVITVTDVEGKPVPPGEAIVYVVGFTEEPAGTPVSIEQRGRRFVPELVAVTAGQEISFPNRDAFLHNVFSASSARPFDLGSYKQGESKQKSFPRPGVVDVYCNIHPEMAATILVLPNQRHARVDRAGRYRIEGIPSGSWRAFAYVRLATKPVSAPIKIEDGADATLDLTIARGQAAPHVNKYGETYRDPAKYR